MRTMTLIALLGVGILAGCGVRGENVQVQAPAISITDRQTIESDGNYNTAPAVAQASDGDWVLVYQKGQGHVTDYLVMLRRSTDQGASWSPEVQYFNVLTPDPTLAMMPNGQLLLELYKADPSGAMGAAYSFSQDDGETWSPFTFFDNPVGNTTSFPTAFLNVDGIMYAASYGPHDDGTDDAFLWDSANSGSNWSKISMIRQEGDAGINETAIANAGAGRLLAISRDDPATNTWAHFSDDSGQTWGNQIDYTPQIGVIELPQLLQVRGALLLFGRQYDPTKTPHEFVAYASYDGGINFTDRTVLDTYTGFAIDGGYSWPLLKPDGSVFIVYYADTENLQKPDIKSLVLHWNKTKAN